MQNTSRNQSLDAVKGFTILIVMLGHVLVLNHMNDPIIYDGIKIVQMPLFMMVSGYFCGRGKRIESTSDYAARIKKKLLSYMLPFFMWTLVFHLDDFTWAFPAYLEQPERGMWFLVTLTVLTIMAYTAQWAASFLKESKRIYAAVVFIIVYGILAAAVYVQNRCGITWLGPHLTIIYIPFFMSAFLYGIHEQEIKRYLQPKMISGIAAAGGIYCLFMIVWKDLTVMNGFVDYVMQMAASFGGCIAVIHFFCRLKEGKAKRFLSWLGMYTLELYAIHYHFARIFGKEGMCFQGYTLQWIGFVILSFTVMSCLSAAVILPLKRFSITDFLFYGKVRKKTDKS